VGVGSGRIFMGTALGTLVLLLGGCSVSSTPKKQVGSPSATESNRPILDRATARDIVLDSWVTDGKQGYFVDASASTTPFSLYDTFWNIKLLSSNARDDLNSTRISRWLKTSIEGGQSENSLPKIAQISYAVGISKLMNIESDKQVIAKVLESLRHRDSYAPNPNVKPNWGSTSQAIEILASVESDVPREVTHNLRQTLRKPPPLDLQNAVDVYVPTLEAAVALDDLLTDKAVINQRLADALKILSEPSDPVMLSAYSRLRDVAARVGRTLPAISAHTCTNLLREGLVLSPADTKPDPQLTYYARRAGCNAGSGPVSSFHSRAGWPILDAAASLRDTVSGYRLATLVDESPKYRAFVAATLSAVWLPAFKRLKGVSDSELLATAARIQVLANNLGVPHRLEESTTLRVDPPRVSNPASDIEFLILVLHADRPTQIKALTRLLDDRQPMMSPTADNAFLAAEDEAMARVLNHPNLHRDALAILGKLRKPDGTYSIGTDAADAAPSMVATLLAAWIKNESVPTDFWKTRRFCTSTYCAEHPSPDGSTGSTSLDTLWLIFRGAHINEATDLPIAP
jgi:hypothetical protein